MPTRADRNKLPFDVNAEPFNQLPLVAYDPTIGTSRTTRGEYNIDELYRDERLRLAEQPNVAFAVLTNRRGERRLIKDGSLVYPGVDFTRLATFPHLELALPIDETIVRDLADFANLIRAHAIDPGGYPANCPALLGRSQLTCRHNLFGHLLADYYDTLVADGWDYLYNPQDEAYCLWDRSDPDGPSFALKRPKRR